MPSGPPRILLFALASGALALAAIGSGGGGGASPIPSASPTISAPRFAQDRPPPLDPRPFLRDFLRYEVGRLGAPGRRRLRATSTAAFARELLSATPRAASPHPPTARIHRLAISYLSRRPPRALVSGSAYRGARLEQFSFLFEARAGVWLASGPGE